MVKFTLWRKEAHRLKKNRTRYLEKVLVFEAVCFELISNHYNNQKRKSQFIASQNFTSSS
jgi:hypothetical protein